MTYCSTESIVLCAHSNDNEHGETTWLWLVRWEVEPQRTALKEATAVRPNVYSKDNFR